MKVSWDDDISNIWKNKVHLPNHQSDNKPPHLGMVYTNLTHIIAIDHPPIGTSYWHIIIAILIPVKKKLL
jgi:hypothetical protein